MWSLSAVTSMSGSAATAASSTSAKKLLPEVCCAHPRPISRSATSIGRDVRQALYKAGPT